MGRVFLIWNAPVLPQPLYTKHNQCLLRNDVRIQQYRSHHSRRYRGTAPRTSLLAKHDTVDRRIGHCLFTIAVLPIFGVSGVQLFAAEASGPTYDKVHPRIGVTAKWIWTIYAGLTAIEVILLLFGGMGLFDSICHSFATTGTGGYSTKQDSIAYYNSPYIEYVIGVFMFLSGINFTLLLLLFTGKLKKVSQNAELKWYVMSVILFTAFIAAVLYRTTPMGAEESFRKAFFK